MRNVVAAGALLAAVCFGSGELCANNKLATSTSSQSQQSRLLAGYHAAMEKAVKALETQDWDNVLANAQDAVDFLNRNRKLVDNDSYAVLNDAAVSLVNVGRTGNVAAGSKFGDRNLMEIQFDIDRIKHERVITQYNVLMEAARKAMGEADFDTAIRRAEDAINVVEQNKAILSGGEWADLKKAAVESRLGGAEKKGAQLAAKEAKGAADAATKEKNEAFLAEAMQRKLINQLRADAKKMEESRRYIEAIDLYKRLLVQSPNDNQAKLALRLCEDTVKFRASDRVREVQAVENTKTAIQNKETLIPYSDVLTYPEDWVDTTHQRK
jgi:hypothetical protein